MNSSIDNIIEVRTRELVNNFNVRRVLLSAKRLMVGPFIFLDETGPEILSKGKGPDVTPHPHIGLATITYLFNGEILHRDSLGTRQRILPDVEIFGIAQNYSLKKLFGIHTYFY